MRALVAGLALLVLVALVSLAVGAKAIPLDQVVRALTHDDGSGGLVVLACRA